MAFTAWNRTRTDELGSYTTTVFVPEPSDNGTIEVTHEVVASLLREAGWVEVTT